jgi:hypothetical protein
MTNTNYQQQAADFLTSTGTEFKTEFLEFGYHFTGDTDKRNIFKCTLSNNKHKYSFRFGSSIKDSYKEIKKPKIESKEGVTIYKGFMHLKAKVCFSHKIETSYPILLAISKDEMTIESLINDANLKADHDSYLADVATYNKKDRFSRIENPAKLDQVYSMVLAKIKDAIKEAQETKETVLIGQADEILHPTAYDVLACIEKHPVYDFADFCSDYGYDEDSRKAFKTYKAVKREWENVAILFNDEQLELLREIQ